jgi:transcriptional regulator with XRE-family HTH domain
MATNKRAYQMTKAELARECAKRIRGLLQRHEPRLTQQTLADVAGVELRAVQGWLSNKAPRPPGALELQRICSLFDISADYLLCLTDEPRPLGEVPADLRRSIGQHMRTRLRRVAPAVARALEHRPDASLGSDVLRRFENEAKRKEAGIRDADDDQAAALLLQTELARAKASVLTSRAGEIAGRLSKRAYARYTALTTDLSGSLRRRRL